MKEIELKELRKQREKHFLQKDGTIIAKVYDNDVHFKKNDEYEEIDNTLIKINDCYINKNNSYKVCFKEFTNNEIMQIQEEDYYIETSLKNNNIVQIQKEEIFSKAIDCVKYENILDNIDIEYNILPTRVKENVVLKNKLALDNELEFIMRTNLKFYENEDGSINATKEDKLIFKLDAPYMYDSNNQVNNNVKYSFKEINGGYNLKLCLDNEWLNSENIKYPVIIDPTITNQTEQNSVYDTYIYSGDASVDRNSQDILKVGVEKINGQDRVNRALIKFDLPTIGTGSQIISANLDLIGYPLTYNSYETDIVNVHRITSSWTEENAKWETMNDKFDSRVEASFQSLRSFIDANGNITTRGSGADITSLVKKWYSSLDNHGILLKLNRERYRSDVIPAFFSKNNVVSGYNPKPILIISYRNQNGIENYMHYQNQKFMNGEANINSYNGNLVTTFDVGSTLNGKMPASLKLIYNTNDVVLNNNFGLPKGYKFNLFQTITELTIDNTLYLAYLDADSTIHYFNDLKDVNDTADNIFHDEDGLNMTIEKYSGEYILLDKFGNRYKFTINNQVGYLTEVIDPTGNKILITYDSNNRIIKIKDANDSEINISYETDNVVVNCPNKTSYLKIINNKLTQIEFSSEITQIFYNDKDIISSIVDTNGKKVIYEYYSQIPYRLKSTAEQGLNSTIGKYYNITYGFNSTTIVDNKNRVYTMTFNNKGNLISVSNLNNNNDIKNAYGTAYEYLNVNNNNYEANLYSNKLLSLELPNKYVHNYLSNSSFELNDVSFVVDNGINASISNEYSEFSLQSLKLVSSMDAKKIVKSVNVPKGDFYTFSAYVKNSNNMRISLSYMDVNNLEVEKISEVIKASETFEKQDITIEYPTDAISDLTIKIYLDNIGTTFIDGIQLEVGEVANKYNMLENSDFSKGISDWNLYAMDDETYENLSPDEYFQVVDINTKGDKALKISMNPAVSTSLMKQFNVNGKGGDTYNISFWYKNEAFETTGQVGDTVYNDLRLIFNYTDTSAGHGINGCTFNPNEKDWQYFSKSFTAEKDFSSFILDFYQGKNANNFYITNLCLFKDPRNIQYQYDENGNIILSKNLSNESSTFEYDKNNQLIKTMDPKGNNLTYEYDNNISDRILNGVSNLGISNEVIYDSNGNPIITRISKNQVKDINNGIYSIRLKGTSNYIRYINNAIQILEDNCNHDSWIIEKVGEYYRINHSIINNKYLTIINNEVKLKEYNNDASLFSLIKNDNGSYHLKQKGVDKYLKVNNNLLQLATLVENDYNFEFYFETIDSALFIENRAEYSEDGRYITSITDSLLNKTTYEVDLNTGLTKSITNANGNKTTYEYDERNQLIKVEQGNKSINYNYDEKNMLTKISQGTKEYNFEYDEFLNMKSLKLGNDIVFINKTYEENNGNLSSVTYGNNNTINLHYDNFDRIKSILKMNDNYNYKYDNNGNLVKIISNNIEYKYTYDLAKRLSEYKMNNFKIKYVYDANNNIVNTTYMLDSKINNIEYVLDLDDCITKTKFDNNEVNYIYDDLGRLVNKNINNTIDTNYTYVTNGNRTSTLIETFEIEGKNYKYKYDKLNNITHIYINDVLNNKYEYDEFSQLIEEENYETNENIIYKYDNNGNIISKTITNILTGNFIKEDKYEYNNLYWEDQLSKMNGETIQYDIIGNPIKIGDNINLNWINGKELNSYSDSNKMVNYKYNVDGVRISKTVNNEETLYYLEGKEIILEKTGSNVIYYIRDEIDGLIGFKFNESMYFYKKNNMDDIIGILDSDYNEIARYQYDSWGNILSITDGEGLNIADNMTHIANINPYRYRSYYYDKETNLYYLNKRYYNPIWGRFLSADEVIGANKDILSCNLYAYASNNPIVNIDPSGAGFFSKLKSKIKKTFKKVVKVAVDVVKYVAKTVVTAVGQIVSVNVNTTVGTSTNTGPGLINVEKGTEVTHTNTVFGSSDSLIKLNYNVNAEDQTKNTIGIGIDTKHISASGEIGFTSAKVSAGIRYKDTVGSLMAGWDDFYLFAGGSSTQEMPNGSSITNYGRLNVHMAIPVVVALIVLLPEVGVPAITPLIYGFAH